MGRGLGSVQKKILEILRTKNPSSGFTDWIDKDKKFLGAYKIEEWYDVASVAYMVLYGLDCFERTDGYIAPTPTESMIQSIWRAVRTLEKRGLIESRMFPLFWMQRKLCGRGGGGANQHKGIRLAHQSDKVD